MRDEDFFPDFGARKFGPPPKKSKMLLSATEIKVERQLARSRLSARGTRQITDSRDNNAGKMTLPGFTNRRFENQISVKFFDPFCDPSLPSQWMHVGSEESAHRARFPGFSESPEGEVYLCSCFKTAVVVWQRVVLSSQRFDIGKGPWTIVGLDSVETHIEVASEALFAMAFPFEITRKSLFRFPGVDNLPWKTGLCHACAPDAPFSEMKISTPGSRSLFEIYFLRESLRRGYVPHYLVGLGRGEIDREFVDADMGELADLEKVAYRKYRLSVDSIQIEKTRLEFKEAKNRIQVEIHMGLKNTFPNASWWSPFKSEEKLAQLISKLFPSLRIERNVRLAVLGGLELDLFIRDLSLGIEYNGEQHYKPVEYFGGEAKFAQQIQRDERKRELCRELGIRLIEFRYDEVLDEATVRKKLEGMKGLT